MSYDEYDDSTLRERVSRRPGPAIRWVAVAVLLLVVELGAVAGAFLKVGGATQRILRGIGRIPRWVADSTAGGLDSAAGIVTAALVTILLLSILAVFVSWLIIPGTLVDRLGLELGAEVEDVVEGALVTLLLGVTVALVVYTPVGALLDAITRLLTVALEAASELPTLTSRETIPNQGHRLPGGGWEGTFLGLSAAWAWAIRVLVIFLYAFAWLAWLWRGYDTFRTHYREADWTPRDDSINRFRNHYWGLFGAVVVFMFVVMALWAPAMSPYTAQENLYNPYDHEFQYLDGDEVASVSHGVANINSRSQGGSQNVGLLSYDEYDRFHPFGTNQDGKDLFAFLAFGARVSLIVGVLATGLGAFAATAIALATAYYKGLLDLVTVVVSDSIISLPRFLLILLLSVLFKEANHPIAQVYDGGILLALIFAATGWPFLWRAVRGPSLQVAEEEWVDAAKSFGQRPATTMRKHMSPYIAGYMLVYASLSLGGIIIGVAALSFLGFGIDAPTPEWGRAVNEGRQYVPTSSWHIATLPGVLVVLVVTGFNALGDGIRDAIDPQAMESGESGAGATATGGGG